MTDPRLHSTEPIDDEVPFEDAEAVQRDESPEDEDAIVTPAANERERRAVDPDIEPSAREARQEADDRI